MAAQIFLIFTPTWGKWSILTSIFFQMGWFNHQLVHPMAWMFSLTGAHVLPPSRRARLQSSTLCKLTDGSCKRPRKVSKDKHRPKSSICGFHVYLDLPRGAFHGWCVGVPEWHTIFLRVQTAPCWKMLVFKHVFLFFIFAPRSLNMMIQFD